MVISIKENESDRKAGKNTPFKRALIGSGVVLAVLILIVAAYLLDYYRADSDALKMVHGINEEFIITESDDYYTFAPNKISTTAFIFYPGAKVQCEAYAPLLGRIAEQGITCYLLKVPANMAILDINAAARVRAENDTIKHWFIGGHSMGGMVSGKYVFSTDDDYEGIILLGSYVADDIENKDMRALLIYGDKDGVLNHERYEESKKHLPDFDEYVIKGGCHAYFGAYGEQRGDGTPTISCEEQIDLTSQEICEWIDKELEGDATQLKRVAKGEENEGQQEVFMFITKCILNYRALRMFGR
ncbi:MAG: hypothetical protein IJM91_05490 [Lachnospiraceae bacterium]|nr:hypothetical protein [Lachnospiraceae bacterium]